MGKSIDRCRGVLPGNAGGGEKEKCGGRKGPARRKEMPGKRTNARDKTRPGKGKAVKKIKELKFKKNIKIKIKNGESISIGKSSV